jgi:uncharacterized protein (TIGR03435 family)
MERALRGLVLAGVTVLIALCAPMAAQTTHSSLPTDAPTAAVKFEIADIHPNLYHYYSYMGGGNLVGDRYAIRQANVLNLIAAAYGLDEEHVLGGPMWLEWKRYDVLAKSPKGATNNDLQPMLRALLADRFQLVVRTETKAMPAYILSVGKGEPKLKKAEPSDQSGCAPQPVQAVAGSAPPDLVMSCRNMSMGQLAETLRYTGRYPVVDQTGLKGNWDFEFHFAWPPRPDGLTTAGALKNQIGLMLDLGKAPLPVVVVESVTEPSPNSPDLNKLIPPPAEQEFEVAMITPAAPNTKHTNVEIRGHEALFRGTTMQFLIMYSYDDVNEATLVDIPPWFLAKRWDITAKIPVDPTAKNSNVDQEDVKAMLRSLLADRFKLQVHREVRPADGWVLVAAGPKLKKAADTEIRPTCGNGPGPDGKDPRTANPILNMLVTCQNVSMPEFAERISSMFAAYIKTPVVDGTGLAGRYDLQLVFTMDMHATEIAAAAAAKAKASVDGPDAVADPTGAISMMDAIPRELGLKLEQKKEPVPVMVVDHIEETPTEN